MIRSTDTAAAPPAAPAAPQADEAMVFPASFAQQRVWFLSRLDPGSPAWNTGRSLLLRGPLRPAVLERALAEVVARHESLRTTFREEDGEPVQVVAPFAGWSLPVRDLSALDAAERERQAQRRAREVADAPFDLARGPLFRAELLRLDDERHVLVLAVHHAVTDGWSGGLLLGEIEAIYAAFARGEPCPLPEPALQYGDYAEWQRGRMRGELLERHLAYWRDKLRGAPVLLELPADRPRPAVESHRGAQHAFTVPAEAAAALRALARAEGATLFMALLAAFKLVLARWSGEDDVVVGTPVAGRDRAELEGVIGMFANTLALRTSVAGDPAFRQLLRRVRETTLEAFGHAELPFEKLVEELRVERSLAHGPVFQVMLALQGAAEGGERRRLGDAEVGVFGTPRDTAKLDLSLYLADGGGELRGGVEYATDLFDAATAARFADHFVRVLGAVAANPDLPVHAVPLLDAGDEARQLREWAEGGGVDASVSTLAQVEAVAARTPDAPAVGFDGAWLTYGELDARANRLARRLVARGVRPGDRVGVCMERGAGMVVALLAAWKAGAAYVPLDPAHPSARTAYVLRDSGAALLVCDAAASAAFGGGDVPVVDVDAEAGAVESDRGEPIESVVPLAAPAYVLYTSGSTGRPKGVVVSHRALATFLASMRAAPGIESSDVLLAVTTLAFDIAGLELWLPLTAGARVVMAPRAVAGDGHALAAALDACGATVMQATPATWRMLLDAGWPGRRGLRALCGGEALPADLAASLLERCGTLWNLYGPTETTIWSTAGRVARGGGTVPIGRPIANARACVLDARGRPSPVGVPGELALGGSGVADGYLGRPALTAERFVPDPFAAEPGARMYRTGDRARWRADGTLEFMGRLDAQVKLRGFRIEPGEIEALLRTIDGVRDAAVVVREDVPGDARLVAYLAADAPPAADEALRARLREQLPEYMVPAAFVTLAALPLTPSGKVDRRALPAPAAGSGERYVAPRTAAERTLAAIWQQVLRVEPVGVNDDFFALGGHSLRATQVAARVRQALGVELPLRALFEARTVARLAARVEAAEAAPPAPPLVPADRTGPLPLSFAQQRLWFLQQLDPDGAAYSVSEALLLRGDLDADAFEAALREIVRRHETLRTVFRATGDGAEQVIVSDLGWALPRADLSVLAPDARRAEVEARARALAAAPWDLAAGPVFRGELLRTAGGEHVLLWAMHHVATDGWSTGVFRRELAALYAAFRRGEPGPLAPLAVQYADYAVWQRGWLSGEVLQGQIDWWRRRLAGAPPALELATDRPRPPAPTFRAGRVDRALSETVAARLEALAHGQGATLFMAMLAGYQLLLSRWAGEDDVVVGTPVANRTHPGLEGLIGYFSNTLALRGDLSGDPTFAALLGRVREETLGAFAHQDLPFERLVEELGVPRDLSRNPVFQAVFSLQEAERGAAAGPSTGVEMTPVVLGAPSAKFDLTLTAARQGHGIALSMVYAADLFDADTVERMMDQLAVLLTAAAADPGTRIAALPLMDVAERERVLHAWNPPLAADDASVADVSADAVPARMHLAAAPSPATIAAATLHGRFAARAARAPHAVAVTCDGESLTYAVLNARANRIARRLRGLGVRPETRVALCLERSVDTVAAILGVLKAGGAYVPLDPAYPADRLAYVLEDSGARVVITHDAVAGRLPAHTAAVLCIDADRASIDAESGDEVDGGAGEANAAYVIYTSGSTGRPKGVEVPHANVLRLFERTETWFEFGAGDVWSLFHSFAFDFSVWELWGALLYGGRVVIVPFEVSRDPHAFLRLLAAERVTSLSQTPSAFAALTRAADELDVAAADLALRVVVFGGEALDPGTLAPWQARMGDAGPRLVNMYGITETTVHVTHRPIASGDVLRGGRSPIGAPIPDLRMYLLDRAFQPVPLGVPGELYVGGAGVARGYLGRPGLTAERFVPDPFSHTPGARLYRTGDRARRMANGELEYLGRVDQQVKVRGFRIEPGEIEAALLRHPAVRDAAVTVREDAPGDRRLAAYVVADGAAPAAAELREHLAARLPDYMVPATFTALPALPLTPNGKLDRRALPAPAAVAEPDGYVPPRTPAEEVLAAVWSDVLKVERVGARDDFFALGGHSIAATQVVSRLREAFRVELPLRALFEATVLEDLAARLEAARRAGAAALPPITRGEHAGALRPASFAQDRYVFLERLFPGSPTYNLPWAVRILGDLDVDALSRAVDEVVRRHEVLRTTFGTRDGAAVVRVAPPPTGVLRVDDLTALPAERRPERVGALAAADARAPFDLAHGPVFRARLLRVDAGEHALLTTWHHIVSDGASIALFFRELSALYAAFARGDASPLAEPPVQYADYAAWQRQHLAGEALAEQLAWWTGHLAGAPPFLELPLDRPRPAQQTHRGAGYNFQLTPALSAALGERARREGATPYMLLMAAYQLLLARWAGQDDVVVGTVVEGRGRRQTEELIGCFVNTLALRARMHGNPTFRQLLAQVRETTLEAYARQELPFERLVEALQPERSLAHAPVFQTMFSLQRSFSSGLKIGELETRRLGTGGTVSKFDLQLFMVEEPDRLRGSLEYCVDLFDAATIERMMGQYVSLLQAVADDPTTPVDELPLMDAAERERVLHAWNPPLPASRESASEDSVDEARAATLLAAAPSLASLAGTTLHGRFAARAAEVPDAVAVRCDGRSLTYAELNARANRLARRLRALGVAPETRVALCLERSVETVAAILGVLKAGGAYVPLDPAYPADRLAYVLEDSGARVVITEDAVADRLPEHAAAVILLDGDREAIDAESGDEIDGGAGEANAAYVIYTSGSTGRPKGVEVPHANVLRLFERTDAWFGFGAGDVWSLFHSFAFDFSVWELWGALLYGGRVVIVPFLVARSPAETHALLRRERVTVLSQTPSAFRELVRADAAEPQPLRHLRYVVFGGEALDPGALAPWLDRYGALAPRLVNMYGITETTVHVTWRPIEGADVRRGGRSPIGAPIPDLRLYLLDRAFHPVPLGVPGEVYVGGAGVARGYLGRPGLTAERFVPDPFSATPGARLYRSGDRARRTADGELEYLGRVDQQVKVRGFRIEPGEIEAALLRHPAVADAAVVVREDTPGDQRLAAYLVPKTGAEAPAVAELRERVGAHVPDYMVPASFTVLGALPLTANGKLDRRALPTPSDGGGAAAGDAGYVAPRTAAEEIMATLLAEVLGVKRVGVEDDFFALGGHSVLALRLMTRIQERFGRELPLATLYRGATAADLARFVEEAPGEFNPIVPMQPLGDATPLFCPHAVGADVFSYEAMARRMAPDWPVYGLRASGLLQGETPLERIEELAARYVEAVTRVYPHGPVRLLGWSMGGMIAYEMAQQLRAAGREIEFLGIVDTRGYMGETLTHVNALRPMLGDLLPASLFEEMRALPLGEQVPLAAAAAQAAGAAPLRMAMLRVYHAHHTAYVTYQACPYDGDISFMRAVDEPLPEGTDPVAWWERHVRGRLRVHRVHALHNTLMTEPHVAAVVAMATGAAPAGESD